MADWFEHLVGFPEDEYEATRRRLEVVGDRLRSTVNGRSYRIGELETPSLAERRARVGNLRPSTGPAAVSLVVADVGDLHRDVGNRRALFQVASQFNLVEMTGPDVSPEDGVAVAAFSANSEILRARAPGSAAWPAHQAGAQRGSRARIAWWPR
jgi:hypothetical protein